MIINQRNKQVKISSAISMIVIFLAKYNKIKSIWKYLMLQPSQFNLFLRIKTPISASFWQLQSQISFLG